MSGPPDVAALLPDVRPFYPMWRPFYPMWRPFYTSLVMMKIGWRRKLE